MKDEPKKDDDLPPEMIQLDTPWTDAQLAALDGLAASMQATAGAVRQILAALRSNSEVVPLTEGELHRALGQARTQAGQGPEFYGGFNPRA